MNIEARFSGQPEVEGIQPKFSAEAVELLVGTVGRNEDGANYRIGYSREETLGEFYPQQSEQDHLVLHAPRDNKAVVLGYSISATGEEPRIVVNFVQKARRASMTEAKRAMPGTHPYEFLVAKFLERIKPILELRPETEVTLAGERSMNDDSLTNRTYNPIRDRFFGKDWRLSLDKTRVREILGDELIEKMRGARR
ncbi:MAG: hypothetical protein ABIH11_08335 [Candidatus Altiarchaeota archaeon]